MPAAIAIALIMANRGVCKLKISSQLGGSLILIKAAQTILDEGSKMPEKIETSP
jgi:hypothetical protein